MQKNWRMTRRIELVGQYSWTISLHQCVIKSPCVETSNSVIHKSNDLNDGLNHMKILAPQKEQYSSYKEHVETRGTLKRRADKIKQLLPNAVLLRLFLTINVFATLMDITKLVTLWIEQTWECELKTAHLQFVLCLTAELWLANFVNLKSKQLA